MSRGEWAIFWGLAALAFSYVGAFAVAMGVLK